METSAEGIFRRVVQLVLAVEAELFVGKVSECRSTGVSDVSAMEELVNSRRDRSDFHVLFRRPNSVSSDGDVWKSHKI